MALCWDHDATHLDVWPQGSLNSGIAQFQCQVLEPQLEPMYATSTFANSPTHPSSLLTTTALSNPSAVPSPDISAHSPYFIEPSTLSEPPAKKSHSRRRPAGHIPRPRNAFILFRSHYVAAQLIPGKVEGNIENDHRHISKIIGEIWNSLPPAERLHWEQKADVEKEKHSRMYPNYQYKPAKLQGIVKRRVKCRATGVLRSPYSSSLGMGNDSPREMVGSLVRVEGGGLEFVDCEKTRFIDQEERRKDRTRCARVAELVQKGVVGEQLEQEAQRLGLDRESAMIGTPQLSSLNDNAPGQQGHFHTNVDVLRALGELDAQPTSLATSIPPQTRDVRSSPCDTMPTCGSPTETPCSSDKDSSNDLAITAAIPSNPFCAQEPNYTEKEDRGWPHRRASSVPASLPPPIYQVFDAHPHLQIIEPSQSDSAVKTAPLPLRSFSMSPTPYVRHVSSARPTGDEGKFLRCSQGPDAFNHITYCSPSVSPSEFPYSPSIGSHIHYPPPEQASPHATLPFLLYGIGVTHGMDHLLEPIDLSPLYPPDILSRDDSTLHSTYATPAGEACSPIPGTPGTTNLDCCPMPKEVDYRSINFTQDLASSPASTGPYDWHMAYGSVPDYQNIDMIRCDDESLQRLGSVLVGPSY